MKKLLIIIVLFTSIQFISNSSYAQRFYVKVRPALPLVIRPIAPRPDHIWIEPEWIWRGGKYDYIGGYWVASRVGYRYQSGYWRRTRRGEAWVVGGWIR